MLETLQQFDQDLFFYINGITSPYFDKFMWFFTAKFTWAPLYAAILYVIWKNFSIGMSLLLVIMIVGVIIFSDQICASVIRPEIQRMRPSNPNNPISEFVHIVNGKRGGRYGFPSCHAANSFGLAFAVMLFFKRKSLTYFFLSWALINSYSRVYLGLHYPGDLFGGLIVGVIGAYISYFIYKGIIKSSYIEKLLKFKTNDYKILSNSSKIQHHNIIIFTGLTTLLVIVIIAAF
ncbi:MAG: phosphatase PAP2 family protein [Culturomica sp.]|jgi:undecaprenyl-diphosphatase|nr:phosphatase PAP2 family protein [Culturomica sp.]